MSQFSQGHALLIGVGTYQHMADVNVPITVKDAQALHQVLGDTTLCGYPANQVKLLHDEETTRTGLMAALDNLAAATKAESTVVFYYAGHGEYGTDGNYYLSTYDSQRQGAQIVAGTGLSEAELIAKLRAIKAKRLLLIFNACHAGAISPNLSIAPPTSLGNTAPPEEALDAILSTGEGRIIMTACRPQQKSWVGNGQLTLFTQALVEGLRGQGYVANSSGYISAFGLYEHLYATVKERAADLGRQQEPEFTVLRGVGPFPIAIFKGATSLGAFDPQEPLPADTAVRTVAPERSQRLLKRYIAQTTTTVGDRGVNITGNVSHSAIITGDGNSVRHINTGSGTYVERDVNIDGGDFVGRDKKSTISTAFNQTGQTVLGPQTNIEGGVNTSGGLFNSGIMNTPGAVPAQPSLAAQLRNLQQAITQAGQQRLFDEDTAIDVEAALRKAINQAEKATPDRQAIQTHLAAARNTLASIPAAGGLVTAVDAISRLFT